jgi:hypothetical protein
LSSGPALSCVGLLESYKLFAQASFEPWSSWSLPPELLGLLQEGSDRELGHQNFGEASLLVRPAVTTQSSWVQRLRPENKGDFPYIPFKAGYRNGGRGNSLSHTWSVICYFIGHSNFWSKVTLLLSHPRCHSPNPVIFVSL